MKTEDILFEDSDIIVIYKEAGIAVQSASVYAKDLETELIAHLSRGRSGGRRKLPELFVIHRLDQPVEGVLVFAKTKEAAAGLNAQLTKGKLTKEYVALVENLRQPEDRNDLTEDTILENYLQRDAKAQKARVVKEGTPNSKRAKLSFRVLNRGKRMLLSIKLDTGRFHQIRAQLAHFGLPIVGDRKYNKDYIENESLALCANRLTFSHPRTNQRMEFTVEPRNSVFGS